MLIFLLLLSVFSSLHKCVVNSLSFLVSVLLRRNVSLCFWATVSALLCLVCSSTVLRNYDDDDDDLVTPLLAAAQLFVINWVDVLYWMLCSRHSNRPAGGLV